MLKRFLSFAAVAMLALVVLAACGGSDDAAEDVTRIPDAANAPVYETPAGTGEGTPPPDVAQATPGGGGGGEVAGAITIVSGRPEELRFDPAEVTIPAGTDVPVTLPNEGALPHNFSIDQLNISVDMAPGETQEATINAPAGQYEFYCNIPGHKEGGMVGTLTAE
jgi:plastocyanin